jgi:hypothetical protein
MGRQIGIGSYWVGSVCAVLAMIARGLDVFGMNFIDFETKGGGFGYHTLMDGTLFFYAISIATMVYAGFISQKGETSLGKESQKAREDTAA